MRVEKNKKIKHETIEFISTLHQAQGREEPGSPGTGLEQISSPGRAERRGHGPQVLSTHKNTLGSVGSLLMAFSFLKPDCDIFGTNTSHKQLFLKGGKRKLPTQKINAVDYSESNAKEMEETDCFQCQHNPTP